MDTVLKEMNGTELFVYLDDIVFYSENLEEHDKKARRLIARLRDVNFKLQLDKYDFLRTEVAFLGHVIGRDGVKPNPAMINAIKKFPNPTIVRAIQQFLGLSGCNRRFIHDYVELAKPLSDLLKKDVKLEWGCNCRRSFWKLRLYLCSEPILRYPDKQVLVIHDKPKAGTYKPASRSAASQRNPEKEPNAPARILRRTRPTRAKGSSTTGTLTNHARWRILL